MGHFSYIAFVRSLSLVLAPLLAATSTLPISTHAAKLNLPSLVPTTDGLSGSPNWSTTLQGLPPYLHIDLPILDSVLVVIPVNPTLLPPSFPPGLYSMVTLRFSQYILSLDTTSVLDEYKSYTVGGRGSPFQVTLRYTQVIAPGTTPTPRDTAFAVMGSLSALLAAFSGQIVQKLNLDIFVNGRATGTIVINGYRIAENSV